MKIYDKSDVEQFDVVIDKRTKLKASLTGRSLINALFTTDTYLDIYIGYYIIWETEKYTLWNEPSVNKKRTNEYVYNLDFMAPKFSFENILVTIDKSPHILTNFPLYGDLEVQLNHIIDNNINRIFGAGTYTLGSFPSGTDNKNILYEDIDCLTALNDIVAEWELEYSLSGSVINVVENVGSPTGLTFQFKQGLKGIQRKKLRENELVTRLYPFGSDRNITNEYVINHGGSKRLKIDPIDAVTIANYGIIERVEIFEDVFPHRTGYVSAIGENENFFIDAGMEFNLNETGILIPGHYAKLTFNTGDLTGLEFEIYSYDHATQTYELKPYDDKNGLLLPDTTFKPSIGDAYVLHGINLPDSYISAAHAELLRLANKFLETASYPTVVYDLIPDVTHIRDEVISLHLGDVIIILDTELDISIETRITEITQEIVDKDEYTLKVGNRSGEGFVRQISNKTSIIDQKINSKTTTLNTKINHIDASKSSTIVNNNEKFFVGNDLLKEETKGLDYVVSGLKIYPNYSDEANHVFLEDCKFTHLTISDSPKTWDITGGLKQMLDDNAMYFIYVKCGKETSVGEFIISKEYFYTYNSSDEYYFLIGVLSAVENESRILNALFVGTGQTSITSVTNISGSSDSAEVIMEKYESNDNRNAFTDSLLTKLTNMTQSANVMTIDFQTHFRIKAEGNTDPNVTEKNDVVLVRLTNSQMYWMIYNTGLQTQLTSYRLIDTIDLNLFP